MTSTFDVRKWLNHETSPRESRCQRFMSTGSSETSKRWATRTNRTRLAVAARMRNHRVISFHVHFQSCVKALNISTRVEAFNKQISCSWTAFQVFRFDCGVRRRSGKSIKLAMFLLTQLLIYTPTAAMQPNQASEDGRINRFSHFAFPCPLASSTRRDVMDQSQWHNVPSDPT